MKRANAKSKKNAEEMELMAASSSGKPSDNIMVNMF